MESELSGSMILTRLFTRPIVMLRYSPRTCLKRIDTARKARYIYEKSAGFRGSAAHATGSICLASVSRNLRSVEAEFRVQNVAGPPSRSALQRFKLISDIKGITRIETPAKSGPAARADKTFAPEREVFVGERREALFPVLQLKLLAVAIKGGRALPIDVALVEGRAFDPPALAIKQLIAEASDEPMVKVGLGFGDVSVAEQVSTAEREHAPYGETKSGPDSPVERVCDVIFQAHASAPCPLPAFGLGNLPLKLAPKLGLFSSHVGQRRRQNK